MRSSSLTFAALGLLSLTVSACTVKASNDEPVSQSEALDAVDETSLSSQAGSLTSASIELSTNFTIGQAVDKAAAELRTFVLTQLPCADVAVSGNTLSVTYGTKPGNCVYHGHTFSGRTQVRITHNDAGDVVVDHTWTDFSNGVVKVNGTAEVTWTLADPSQRVVHHLVWTRLSDGRTGTGTGDRTDTPLHGDISTGVLDNGHYTWDGSRGHWDLSVQGVEARWSDPAPQAGSFVLTTPKDQTVTMSFSRVDADSIRVTVTSAGKRFSFMVNKVGVQSAG
jgi:hypothetical protein